jgi:hypothetical protein
VKYLLLIYGSDEEWQALSEEEKGRQFGEYEAVARDAAVVGGAQLQGRETATVVRVEDDETLTTDGPFAETKEQLGGYFVVECGDRDEAVALAARIPAARYAGVEVRPIVDRGAPG